MSNSSALASLEFEVESSFGENLVTYATGRIPLLDKLDLTGLKQDKLAPQRVVQYRQDGTAHILGPQSGEIKTKLWLTGHGISAAGAVTLDAIETLLGYVFGNSAAAATSGTVAAAGSTLSAINTVAASGFGGGSLCRIGVAGDGRGNGQYYPVSSHSTSVLSLINGCAVAPLAGDVISNAAMIFPSEIATNGAVQSVRMRALTANACYELHGVYAKAASIGGLNPGELPYVEITWAVSWWIYGAGTLPSSAPYLAYLPSPSAGGSLMVQNVSTLARTTRTMRNMQLDYTLGVVDLMGQGGTNQFQTIVGARRTPDTIKATWVEDFNASTDALFLQSQRVQLCYTHSPNANSSFGFYAPNACITGARPIQMDDGGINRQKIEAMLYTGGSQASDQTLSAIRFAMS